MSRSVFFVVALCISIANGLAFVAPKATAFGAERTDREGWTPAPTNAPLPIQELLKRQVAASGLGSTILRAKDGFWGYLDIDGVVAGWNCRESTETAFLQPASNTAYSWGIMGCCGNGYCRAPTSCVNSRQYSTSCKGLPCETDVLIRKCTDPSMPYCRTNIVRGVPVSGNFCDYYSGTKIGTVYTSLSGGNRTAIYSTTIIRQSILSASITTTRSLSTTPSGPSFSTISTSLSDSSTTTSSTPSSTAISITPLPAASAPVPVGAIVGGSIGGFAVLALIGFGIFFLLLRRRREKEELSRLDYTVHPPQPLAPPIFVAGGSKHSSIHSQSAYTPMFIPEPNRASTASPLGGSYMSGPGFDGPYEPSHELSAVSPTAPTTASGTISEK